MSDNTQTVDFDVVAEDAPIGVQLWPTTAPVHAPNFTLAEVHVIRTATATFVRWVYESGTTREFSLGEKVACRRDVDAACGGDVIVEALDFLRSAQ